MDDDKVICLIQENNLRKLPVACPISVFQNAQQALEYLEQQQDSPKKFLILLDINMPVLNGWEFLEQCQHKIRDDKYYTVMVTSSIEACDKKRALQNPRVLAFIEKPLVPSKAESLKSLKELRDFFIQEIS